MKSARTIHKAYGLWASRKRRALPKPPVDELARILSTWEARHALRVRQQAEISARTEADCFQRIVANEAAMYGLPPRRAVLPLILLVVAILAGAVLGYLGR